MRICFSIFYIPLASLSFGGVKGPEKGTLKLLCGFADQHLLQNEYVLLRQICNTHFSQPSS